MVKAPVVRMHKGGLFGAEVIVPVTGTAERSCGIGRVKNREPATIGALRLGVSINAGCAAFY